MRTFMLILGLLILVAMPFRSLGAEAAPAAAGTPAPEKLGDNAALKYWIAFELMPKLNPERDNIVTHWSDTPINDASAAVVSESENALRFLREATHFRRCDWGLIENGPGTLAPHIGKARQLARLACLCVRYLAVHREGEEAVSSLLSIFTLSRQVNYDGRYIGFFGQWSIEKMATEAAAGCLTRLVPERLRTLASGLDALPERRGFREVILSDRADVEWLARSLNEGDREAKENRIKMMLIINEGNEGFTNMIGAFAGDEQSRAKAEKDWAARKITPEELSQYTRGFGKALEHYKVFAELGSLPLPEFDRQTKVIGEKLKTDCPFAARFLFVSLPMVRYEDAASEARMAMLRAAIAIVLDGPDRLKDFKDPFGDGPFEYRQVGNGFELKSRLLVHQAAVTLTVPGQP